MLPQEVLVGPSKSIKREDEEELSHHIEVIETVTKRLLSPSQRLYFKLSLSTGLL